MDTVLPYSDGWVGLVLTHLAATAAMVGLMWTVHFVHYPMFGMVADDRYVRFQSDHMRRISWVLVVPWGVEVVTAGALVVSAPDQDLRNLAVLGLVGVAAVVGTTALLAAPAHGRLLDGFDDALHRRLLAVDAVRTAIWTLRLVVAAAIAWTTVT